MAFRSDQLFALNKFQQFLDFHLPPELFRIKGILWFQESPTRYFCQLTGKRFQLEDSEWPEANSSYPTFRHRLSIGQKTPGCDRTP